MRRTKNGVVPCNLVEHLLRNGDVGCLYFYKQDRLRVTVEYHHISAHRLAIEVEGIFELHPALHNPALVHQPVAQVLAYPLFGGVRNPIPPKLI